MASKSKAKTTKRQSKPKLTAKQKLFVENYLITLNAADAVRKAGYPAKNADNMGSQLLKKELVNKAIKAGIADRVKRLHFDQDQVLLHLVAIVKSNLTDYLTFGAKGVSFREMETIDPEKLQLIKEISQGPKGMKISLFDKLDALEKIARHLGMYERPRQARKNQDEKVSEILLKLRDKEINAAEAAIEFDICGIPIPDSVRLLLARMEPEPQSTDNGDFAVITPEEMAQKAKDRLAQITGQEANFIQTRKTEVEELKEEMGGGSFDAQTAEEAEGKND